VDTAADRPFPVTAPREHGAMTIRRANPRRQGEIGLGAAIAWFTGNGYLVSVPLCDNQPYDLVVDRGGRLLKVQVKTTTARSPRRRHVVDLRTNGGNQSRHTSKPFDPGTCDLLFVLTDSNELYLVPTVEIGCRASVTLGVKYDRHLVSGATEPR
jgi:hypothetical protein